MLNHAATKHVFHHELISALCNYLEIINATHFQIESSAATADYTWRVVVKPRFNPLEFLVVWSLNPAKLLFPSQQQEGIYCLLSWQHFASLIDTDQSVLNIPSGGSNSGHKRPGILAPLIFLWPIEDSDGSVQS